MDERNGLRSEDAAERLSAAESLSLMGPDASFAAVDLVNACADEEAIRDFAVAALEELGPPPVDALPGLIDLASHDDALVAYWAITLLGRAGVSAKSGEARLVSVLETAGESSVKERAAWALGQIGSDSEPAIEALKRAAGSSEARLSRLAKASLEQAQVKP